MIHTLEVTQINTVAIDVNRFVEIEHGLTFRTIIDDGHPRVRMDHVTVEHIDALAAQHFRRVIAEMHCGLRAGELKASA
jgi:hypothetical protein